MLAGSNSIERKFDLTRQDKHRNEQDTTTESSPGILSTWNSVHESVEPLHGLGYRAFIWITKNWATFCWRASCPMRLLNWHQGATHKEWRSTSVLVLAWFLILFLEASFTRCHVIHTGNPHKMIHANHLGDGILHLICKCVRVSHVIRRPTRSQCPTSHGNWRLHALIKPS